jgi:hypothetical protein
MKPKGKVKMAYTKKDELIKEPEALAELNV